MKKFKSIPNTGHMQLWLQRSVIKVEGIERYFDENICRLVSGDEVQLWNNEWLHASLVNIFNINPIVDQEKLEAIDEVINNDEVLHFGLQSL